MFLCRATGGFQYILDSKNDNFTALDSKNTKRVDPIKEALKKWQKEKRHRQMQEKKTKKMPFRVSHVSHPVSEYSHTFQNTINPSSKVMQNELKVLTQNNVSLATAADVFSVTNRIMILYCRLLR